MTSLPGRAWGAEISASAGQHFNGIAVLIFRQRGFAGFFLKLFLRFFQVGLFHRLADLVLLVQEDFFRLF